jgi:glycosyltransferase involved in cell wall biosynthesis
MEVSDKPITLVCSFKNEEIAGPAFVSDLLSHLKPSAYKYNLILVDDGSTDQTTNSLLPYTDSNVSLLKLDRNIGKVAAQAVGARKFHNAASDLVFFDGDGQHHALEILKIIHHGRLSSNITVGERSQQYQRKLKSKAGIVLLRGIFKLLGIKTSLQNSELVFIPSQDTSKILSHVDFGFLPINNLLT